MVILRSNINNYINITADSISGNNFGSNNSISYYNKYENNNDLIELKNRLRTISRDSRLKDEWFDKITGAIKDLSNIEQATSEQDLVNSKSKSITFFEQLKKVKDWVSIFSIPADVESKGDKTIELLKSLPFDFLKDN